jgi:LPXTG-site transpeptidase (sortase) family protein
LPALVLPGMPKSKSKFSLSRIKNISALHLIGAGLVIVLVGSGWRVLSHWPFSQPVSPSKQEEPKPLPARIEIPDLGVSAEVKAGGVVEGRWLLEDNTVMVLPDSGRPGEGFNTVLYAHNRPDLFGRLNQLADGAIITLETSEKEYHYELFSREQVAPDQLDRLYSDIQDTITLFTCDGWFDSQRLVVKAKLVSQNEQ